MNDGTKVGLIISQIFTLGVFLTDSYSDALIMTIFAVLWIIYAIYCGMKEK